MVRIIICALAIGSSRDSLTLIGVVQNEAGRPIAEASVFIRSAGPRKGVGVL
jgi:hypothetical protein